MTKTHKINKYIFNIDNIDIKNIEKRFGFKISNIDNKSSIHIPDNTTKIEQLKYDNINFIDEAKKPHKCNISMIDFNTNNILINNNYSCFWCKDAIPEYTLPIGCPIKYIPNKTIKTYHSNITKDLYKICQNITKNMDVANDDTLNTIINDYYVTDGIFCSFNCCGAWIKDSTHNSMYDMSYTLLVNMYQTMYPTSKMFENAPHWRTLTQYGGYLTTSAFRDSFNKIDYKEHGVNIPTFHSIQTLFEEKLKF